MLSSLVILSLLTLLLILLRATPDDDEAEVGSRPSIAGNTTKFRQARDSTSSETPRRTAQPASGEASSLTAARHKGPRKKLNPIPPTGWRRTTRGWEHVGSWPNVNAGVTRRSDLNALIAQQRAQEPGWLTAGFRLLRQIPPLGYATLQLAAIGIIVQLANRTKREATVG